MNLPGRASGWRNQVRSIEERDGQQVIHWLNGFLTVAPPDDNPQVFHEDGETRLFPRFGDVEPADLRYIDPHDLSGITWPWSWGFGGQPTAGGFFLLPGRTPPCAWSAGRHRG